MTGQPNPAANADAARGRTYSITELAEMTGWHRDTISDWTRRKENPLPVASGGSHGIEYQISFRRLIEWRDEILETAAHGAVVTRAGFVRREVTTDLGDGKIPLLTGEPVATLAEADAPGTDIGDLAWIDGRLHTVRSALADGGGGLRLQLTLAQRKTGDLAEEAVEVAVVGEPDGTAPVVALAPAGVLRRSDLVSLDGDSYRVGTPTEWPAGGLRRYLLIPV